VDSILSHLGPELVPATSRHLSYEKGASVLALAKHSKAAEAPFPSY